MAASWTLDAGFDKTACRTIAWYHYVTLEVSRYKTMEIRALTRAAQILASVKAEPAGATLMEIVDDVALSKATTYRFLQALLTMDFLRVDPERGTYHIGPVLLGFGRHAVEHQGLRAAAHPFLEALRASTGETVTLVVPSGAQRLTLDVVLSEQELRAVPELGALKPIHAGAAGKAMLAWYPADDLRSLFKSPSLKRVTERTVATLSALQRDLVRVRERGYAVSVGETVFGQAASAAPVFDADGKVVASINISGPAIRMPSGTLRTHGLLAVDMAESLSKKLGWKKKGVAKRT